MLGRGTAMLPGMDPRLSARINAVTARRSRAVLDHILKHGKITTRDLKETYGYSHPPRAARDVRERGIPLRTTFEKGPDGRRMAVYSIDEDAGIGVDRHGRCAFPKALKDELIKAYGERCALCGGKFPARALQIDHRVPYEITGDAAPEVVLDDFMLVCGSCNRTKSWSCEHCPNWTGRDAETCRACMWSGREIYTHVATLPLRRLDLIWEGAEVRDFDKLLKQDTDGDVRALVKLIVRRSLRGGPKS